MSTAGARPGLSLDSGGLWHKRAMQRSRALVRTYLKSNSVLALPQPNGTRQRDSDRLPSLAAFKASHRQTTTPLSISEPSLFTLGERAVSVGFSPNRRPPLRKRHLPLCKSCDTIVGKNLNQSNRPVYSHFSYPIRPNPELGKPRSQSLTLAKEQGELRPPVMQHCQSSHWEGLTVRGKPCLSLPSQSSPPAASMPARTQLHIFLPTERIGGREEGDSESVDEGFMDELDSKITSLKLQQGEAKIHTHTDKAPGKIK
ncbi:uncharacterized protein ACWYII_022742 [Salvelinus alpinus]|uniref:uncharacterized protein n=1 Tax=Salvelinus alpinus TaxID=8036 RepID=UPI0039FD00F7